MHTLLLVLMFAVLPAAFVLLGGVSVLTHRQFLRILRDRHSLVWRDLGEPELFWSFPRYKLWLLFAWYDKLKDADLSAAGDRMRGAAFLGVVTLVLWAICAYIGGYLRYRPI